MNYFNRDAEMALLGSMVLSNRVSQEVVGRAQAEWFFQPAHRIIYSAIRNMVNKGKPVADFLLLVAEIGADLHEVGGQEYLLQIAEYVPSASNFGHYLDLVEDQYRLRSLVALSDEIRATVDSDESVQEKLNKAALLTMQTTATDTGVRSTAQVAKEMMATIDRRQEKGVADPGLPTGLADVDARLGGLEPGRLYVVGARPSVGKSAFGAKLAVTAANHGRALFCSLEMSQEQVIARLVAMKTGVSTKTQKTVMNPADWKAVSDALGWVYDLNLSIDDRAGVNVQQVRSRALREAEKGKLSVIVVDYVQLMSGGRKNDSRQQLIGEVTRGLKALAKDLQVPVVALAQLGREAEATRPSLRDLREAGDIENDADVVMLLHRAGKREEWNQTDVGVVECIIAKNRDGENGTALLAYLGSRVLFNNLDWEHQQRYWDEQKAEAKSERETRRRAA